MLFRSWAVTVTYEYYLDGTPIAYSDIRNAGLYTVKAVFATNRPNYKAPAPVETNLTIAKAKVNVRNAELFSFADGAKQYTGSALSLEVTKYPTDLVDVYGYEIKGGGEAINAGEYVVVVTFTLKDSTNYEFENGNTLEANLVIEAKSVTLADLGLAWNYTNMAGYDADTNSILVTYGETFSHTMTLTEESLAKLAENGIVVSYETRNSALAVVDGPVTLRGSYVTTATFTVTGGGTEIADAEFTMEIECAISPVRRAPGLPL